MPFLETFIKVLGYNVPSNTGKGHGTLSPLLKTEVKLVVLDPLDAADVLLWKV